MSDEIVKCGATEIGIAYNIARTVKILVASCKKSSIEYKAHVAELEVLVEQMRREKVSAALGAITDTNIRQIAEWGFMLAKYKEEGADEHTLKLIGDQIDQGNAALLKNLEAFQKSVI